MRDSGRELLRTALDTLNAPEAQHAQETHDASRDELVRSAEAGDEAALKALADSLTRDEAASLLEEIDAGERIAKQQALAALTPKHETAAALAKAAPAERQQLAELARSTERDSSGRCLRRIAPAMAEAAVCRCRAAVRRRLSRAK